MNFKYIICSALAALAVCTVCSAQDLKPVKDKATKKFGYQDKSKNWVIEPTFDKAKAFNMGTAIVTVGDYEGVIDENGEYLVLPELTNIPNFDKDGLSRVNVKENKTKTFGVINLKGEFIIPLDCSDAYIDNRNKRIYAEKFFDIDPGYDPDYASAWGVYDYEGNEIFPPQFKDRPSFDSYGEALITDKASGRKGIIDIDGQILMDAVNYYIEQRDGRYFVLGDDFHWRLYTKDFVQVGDEYLAFANWGNSFRSPDGYYKALKGGSWGVIDANGRVIRPFAFSDPVEAEKAEVPRFDEREMADAQARAAERPWAVAPYDTQDDDVRAASYGRLMMGTSLTCNMIKEASYSGEPSSRFDVKLSSLKESKGAPVSWGYHSARFMLMEPIADDNGDLVFSRTGQAYTIQLVLYEATGKCVEVFSPRGKILGTTEECILYESEEGKTYFISKDVNFPSDIKELTLTNFRKLPSGSLETAFGFSSSEIRTLSNYWLIKRLHTDVGVLQKTGWQSYEAPAVLSRAQRDIVARVGDRYPFLRRKFRQEQAYTFSDVPKFDPDRRSDTRLSVDPVLMAHYEDNYSPSSYAMTLDEPVFWGVYGDRYIKIELEPFLLTPEEMDNPELAAKVPGIVDDVFGSGYAFRLAFRLYEDDGTYVRTVGKSTGVAFGEEDIIGFRDLDWAFSRIPDNYGTIRFRMMHPYSNKLSDLKWIEF